MTDFYIPASGVSTSFNAATTVSGVLDQKELYRLCADEDLWLLLNDGTDALTAGGTDSLYLPADTELFIRTSANKDVLHYLGATTSGLCNVVRMDE